ncbi:hypothetical protein [Martelella sp. HB161492]|uniref:hypothetical protein n=1 Tax=Martelella sp. HB161492 TaxID=2720726 RepID=UPI001591F143|nr:hypothetical protein [Martelella sp. HB161492]
MGSDISRMQGTGTSGDNVRRNEDRQQFLNQLSVNYARHETRRGVEDFRRNLQQKSDADYVRLHRQNGATDSDAKILEDRNKSGLGASTSGSATGNPYSEGSSNAASARSEPDRNRNNAQQPHGSQGR